MILATPGSEGLSARLAERWNRFFYAEGPALSFGLFRIVFAFCLFSEVATTRRRSLFAIEGGFHLPYLPFIPTVSESTFQLLHDLQYPFIVLLGLGVFSRLSCGVLLLLQGYVFFSDQLNFRNHPYFFLLLLLLLMCSPAAEAASFRSVRLGMKGGGTLLDSLIGPTTPLTIQRMIQLQVCLVYLYAGLQKCTGYFLSGGVLAYHMTQSVSYWRRYFDVLFEPATADRLVEKFMTPQAQAAPSIITVVLELGLPLALWHRWTRGIALVAGGLFHVGIAALMDIWTFSGVMLGSYFLFLDPDTMPRVVRRVLGRGPSGLPPSAARSERRRAAKLEKREAKRHERR